MDRRSQSICHPQSVHLLAIPSRTSDLRWAASKFSLLPRAFSFDKIRKLRSILPKTPTSLVPHGCDSLSFTLQFAYNEASFFLIRFLQKFDSIELAPDGQPSACRPPAVWKTISDSRKSVEHFIPKSHLTMYAKVRISFTGTLSSFLGHPGVFAGWETGGVVHTPGRKDAPSCRLVTDTYLHRTLLHTFRVDCGLG